MIKYKLIPHISLQQKQLHYPQHPLAEVVHLNDPAVSVLDDFRYTVPHTITEDTRLDNAIAYMKMERLHIILINNSQNNLSGVLASEDLLGAKPIKLLETLRGDRSQLTAKMLMTPADKIMAFNLEDVLSARVGNIVNSLIHHQQHYALVTGHCDQTDHEICGLFNASQISRQLHTDISNLQAKPALDVCDT